MIVTSIHPSSIERKQEKTSAQHQTKNHRTGRAQCPERHVVQRERLLLVNCDGYRDSERMPYRPDFPSGTI